MTNQNYTLMTNQELVDYVNKLNKKPSGLNKHINFAYPDLAIEFKSRTQFLDDYYAGRRVSIFERMYCLTNDIHCMPTCAYPGCNKIVEWNNDNRSYRKYCCRKHCMSDPSMRKASKETKMRKYGDENYNNRQKAKQTNEERYGVSSAMKLKSTQEKAKETCMRHFGVEYPGQSQEVQEKMRKTNLDTYGVEYPSQSQQIKDKIKHTSIERYGGIGFASQELSNKSKESLFERYGVYVPIYSNEILSRIQNTVVDRYGETHPMKSDKIKQKVKNTIIERYGVESTFNIPGVRDKINQTKIDRYGDVNYNNHNKANKTMMERYGVQWYSQSIEFHKKCHKPYTNEKYPDMTFGSSWEFKLYDCLKEHNIQFEYQPSISLPYEYNGEIHTYHPDFLIENGKLVEVKGDQFFRFNESTGKEEMYCPYRYDDWSDERYELECGKIKAKYQCILDNNVIIIRKRQIENIDDIVNTIIKEDKNHENVLELV